MDSRFIGSLDIIEQFLWTYSSTIVKYILYKITAIICNDMDDIDELYCVKIQYGSLPESKLKHETDRYDDNQ